MPRVTSFARQRVNLGISRRTNAGVVRRYRRSRVLHRTYKRKYGAGVARLRKVIRGRLMPGIRMLIRGRSPYVPVKYATNPYSGGQVFSPRQTRFQRAAGKLM